MTNKISILIADQCLRAPGVHSWLRDAVDIEVATADDGLQAMTRIAREPPDLVILDVDMPGADGLSVAEQMARDKPTAAIPVIILTGRATIEVLGRCVATGAHHVPDDQDAVGGIRAVIRDRLGIDTPASSAEPADLAISMTADSDPAYPKILVVDDDARILEVFTIQLSTFGATVVTATNGYEALTVAAIELPNVIITDYMMPVGSGDYLINGLRSDPILKDIPVIVLTGRTFEGREDVALKRDLVGRGGAVAFLTKPVGEDQFLAEIRKHVKLRRS